MSSLEEEFAAILREKRDEVGLTQEELANAIGVTSTTLSRWERGLVEPHERHKRQALAYLHEASKQGRSDMILADSTVVRFKTASAAPAGPWTLVGNIEGTTVRIEIDQPMTLNEAMALASSTQRSTQQVTSDLVAAFLRGEKVSVDTANEGSEDQP